MKQFPHPPGSTIEPEEMPVEYYDEEIVPEWEEEPLSFSQLKEKTDKKVILRLLNDNGTVILHNTDYNFDVDYSYFELNSMGKLYPNEGVSKRMGLVLANSNRTPVVK